MDDTRFRLPPEYWHQRATEIDAALAVSAQHPRGAADTVALRAYREWLYRRWLKVSPVAVIRGEVTG